MAAYSVPFWRSLCLIALCAISLQVHAARDDEADDEMDEVTPEELQMQEIPVDERIFVEKWNEVPYKKSYFTYTDKQIRDKWEYLMRGLKVPYPSAAYMKETVRKVPLHERRHRGLERRLSGAGGPQPAGMAQVLCR